MDIGVSLLTNTIFAGKSKPLENGLSKWVGKKEDITDKAVKAVFEYMYNSAKETGYYQLSIKGYGKMSFEREENNGKDKD